MSKRVSFFIQTFLICWKNRLFDSKITNFDRNSKKLPVRFCAIWILFISQIESCVFESVFVIGRFSYSDPPLRKVVTPKVGFWYFMVDAELRGISVRHTVFNDYDFSETVDDCRKNWKFGGKRPKFEILSAKSGQMRNFEFIATFPPCTWCAVNRKCGILPT